MVVSLVKDLYFDFNVTHLLEKLRDSHGIDLSYSTLYRWCREEKLVKAPRRTRRKPKKARPRMRREGYEAKDRVERSFRTIQDRLIPEMRINGIKSMKEANFYLKNTFIREYWNKKNVIPPVDPETAFLELSDEIDLDEICAFKFDRKTAKDQTISWKGKKYPVSSEFLPDLRGFNANIRVLLNGDMRIFVMGRKIESEGLTKPVKEPFKPKEDTDFDKAMRTFYFRYVNQIYCELREHLATGKVLDMEKVLRKPSG